MYNMIVGRHFAAEWFKFIRFLAKRRVDTDWTSDWSAVGERRVVHTYI